MKPILLLLCMFGLLGAPFVQGASPALRVPLLGFAATNQPPSLRPVIGAVGAGVFGDPLALPDGVTRLWLSPSQNYALAEFKPSGQISVLTVSGAGAGSPQPITGAFARSELVEFSPSGASAALYSALAQKIQVITNLPGSPHVSPAVDVSALGSPLTALAVSDDGATLLVGVSDGASGSIYLLTSGGSKAVAACGKPSAIRIAPDGGRAAVADSADNQVLAISNLSAAATATVLAQASAGVDAPTAIEFLTGGIAVAGANTLLIIDTQSGKISTLRFDGSAAALFPLEGRTALALVSSQPSAVWLAGRNLGVPVLTWIAGQTPKVDGPGRKAEGR